MTDRIDHAAEAAQHIEWAHDQQAADGEYEHTVRDNALLAQVHATLALVEQQRIANAQKRSTNAVLAGILIALAKPGPGVHSWAADADSAVHSLLADTETWLGMGDARQLSAALGIEVHS